MKGKYNSKRYYSDSNVKENDEDFKFLEYPFNNWIQIINSIYKDSLLLIDSGKMYQKTVNQILQKDIFEKNKFTCETECNNLKLDYIVPDFLVKEIDNLQIK